MAEHRTILSAIEMLMNEVKWPSLELIKTKYNRNHFYTLYEGKI